jgi:hypothetical protein
MVYGSIFEGFRNTISLLGAKFSVLKFFSDLLSCMMCTSTWVGFFLGFVLISPSHYLFLTPKWYSWFFDGLMASGAVWAMNSIIEWFEENRPNTNHL